MANQKQQKLTPTQQQYQQVAKQHEPPRASLKNFVRAFLVGGLICVIAQGVQQMFISYFGFSQKSASNPTVAVMVLLAVLLTGFGIYDRIAQWAGAGTAVPVTGFANSIASTALEHKTEGYVLGVGGNMFKLAGSVIVFGVVAAFVVGLIKTLFTVGG